MNDKPAFGTKEWASRNENSIKVFTEQYIP